MKHVRPELTVDNIKIGDVTLLSMTAIQEKIYINFLHFDSKFGDINKKEKSLLCLNIFLQE